MGKTDETICLRIKNAIADVYFKKQGILINKDILLHEQEPIELESISKVIGAARAVAGTVYLSKSENQKK